MRPLTHEGSPHLLGRPCVECVGGEAAPPLHQLKLGAGGQVRGDEVEGRASPRQRVEGRVRGGEVHLVLRNYEVVVLLGPTYGAVARHYWRQAI